MHARADGTGCCQPLLFLHFYRIWQVAESPGVIGLWVTRPRLTFARDWFRLNLFRGPRTRPSTNVVQDVGIMVYFKAQSLLFLLALVMGWGLFGLPSVAQSTHSSGV